MWVDRGEVVGLLQRIAAKIGGGAGIEEDLLQEALVHLWKSELKHPGNTLSWHIQSCFFHLKNLSRCGRSIDSPRRHAKRCGTVRNSEALPLDDTHAGAGMDSLECGCDVVGQVAAEDARATLSVHLAPRDQEILNSLLAGEGLRQIAVKLNVSHTDVIKHRRRIAACAVGLGLGPPRTQGSS
jgi:DNA-directed RNA polymerase specialized sigma24 family protein